MRGPVCAILPSIFCTVRCAQYEQWQACRGWEGLELAKRGGKQACGAHTPLNMANAHTASCVVPLQRVMGGPRKGCWCTSNAHLVLPADHPAALLRLPPG